MLFTNVGIPGGKEQTSSIRIEGSKIISVGNDSGGNTGDKSDVRINFDGALAFPGLINSHDHLEFNLYPQLADKVYEITSNGERISTCDIVKRSTGSKCPVPLEI